MNAQTKIEAEAPTGLALLRVPFGPHQISKLPKETRKQIDERKNRVSGCMVWKCTECGSAHHKDAVHLDYVGHAAATDRLLDADPRWTWDPVPDPVALGLPTAPGGMWIKLTVDGVTRYGFGSADGKTGGDAIKEIIGDAIRNAGMRFGMALDLWHKGQLHLDDEPAADQPSEGKADSGAKSPSRTAVQKGLKELTHHMGTITDLSEWYQLKNKYSDLIAIVERDYPDWWNGWPEQPDGFTPLRRKIEMLESDLAPSDDGPLGDDQIPY